jgi:hypothetical protein
MRALVLNQINIESRLNALDFILIDLVFLQGILICDHNRHASLVAQPAKNTDMGHVIAQFVARRKGYKVEGQTGVTGTYPTQCHHDGEVLFL